MKKILFFLPIILYAAFPNFRPCLLKYSYIKNEIPINKEYSITFNKTSCVKYDPFTKMCVTRHKNSRYIRIYGYYKLGWWGASVKKDEIYVGNFAQKGFMFTPAKLSVKSLKNSIITDSFCRAVGIGRGDGFFNLRLIKHFVKYGYWGDIGIEVNRNLEITSFDPYYIKGIKTGEKIVSVNGKRATSENFEKYVLFNKAGNTVYIKIGKKRFRLKIRKKRYLFTPLEHFGIFVKKDLTVYFKNPKYTYSVFPNSKLIKVNGKKIKDFNSLLKALSTYKNVTITVEKNGITMNIPLR